MMMMFSLFSPRNNGKLLLGIFSINLMQLPCRKSPPASDYTKMEGLLSLQGLVLFYLLIWFNCNMTTHSSPRQLYFNWQCRMTEILAQDYVREAMSNMNFDFCCSQTHPGVTCNGMGLMMLMRGLKPVIKTYLPVHIVPFLLFKRKKFMKNPLLELFKLFVGILRSVLFGVGYYPSYKRWSCLLFSHSKYNRMEVSLCTALGGWSLIFETPGRQAEIALFSVYKSMEILYNMGKRRKLPVTIPAGNCVMTGVAMSIICYHYINNRDMIKRSYAEIIDKLLENS